MAAYFWVGGSGTWNNSSTTNWATSSGGAGGAGVPTNADTATFDTNSGTTATVTVAATAVSLSTTVNKSDINLSLSGSPTLCTAAGTLTLTTGTITLNNNTLSVGALSSSGTGTRVIAFGTGTIALTSTTAATTILDVAVATNYSSTGTPKFTRNQAATATFNYQGSSNYAPNLYVTTGASALTLGASANLGILDFTGSTCSVSGSVNVYGNITLATGGTYTSFSPFFLANLTVTSNGKTLGSTSVSGGGVTATLADAMATGAFTLTRGTLDLNGKTLTATTFASSNSNTRTLAFGAIGSIACTSTGTVWNTATVTGMTVTGTPSVNITSVGSTAITVNTGALSEANVISFNFTGGTYALTFLNSAGDTVKSVDFTGYAGTLGATSTATVYGDLKLSTGMTLTTSANALALGATSGTQTITSNGKTMDFPLTISGGGTITCADALTLGSTQALTFSLGTLQLKSSATSTVGSFVTSGTTLKYLQSTTSGTQATISDASGTNTVTYLSIQDSNATGGATFDASSATNVNAGNNTGWTLPVPVVSGGNFLFLFN